MSGYIIRRMIRAVLVVLVVTILLFLTMRLLPGDPLAIMLSSSEIAQISPQQLAALRHEYGLDKPLVTQYYDWISSVVHGDLGKSIYFRTAVTSELGKRVPVTLHIGLLAFIIGFFLGLAAGVICAVRRGKWEDTVVTVLANAGITVPGFWLAIMLIYVVSLKFKILPVFGYVSPFKDFWDSTRHIILPVFCLSIHGIASTCRQTRSSMLEVLQQDYIRTAWSKGLKERIIIVRHALKNALIPVITLTGMGVATLIGGAVLIEQVFNIPGMGRLAVQSIINQDYTLAQGITLVIATAVVLVNLFVDISMGWFDPRVRLQ